MRVVVCLYAACDLSLVRASATLGLPALGSSLSSILNNRVHSTTVLDSWHRSVPLSTSVKRCVGLRFKLLETIKMQSEPLRKYGWDDHFESTFESVGKEGIEPGRVLAESHQRFRVYTADGEI